MSDDAHLRIPSWVPSVLLASATAAGGGAVGVGVGRSTAEQPAAIVTRLDYIATEGDRVRVKLDTLETQVQSIRTDLAVDRWRGSDHQHWIDTDFRPLRLRVEQAIGRIDTIEARLNRREALKPPE